MATKTKQFIIFGVKYRTRQFAAVRSMEIMNSKADPLANLERTEVLDRKSGHWIALDSREVVNEYVRDVVGFVAPREVLECLLKAVNEFSFGFAEGWKGVKIPRRFTGEGESKTSAHIDPLLSQLIQEDVASLQQLEGYYSLSDAFAMFDVMVAKGVNEAIANEAAMKDAKKR